MGFEKALNLLTAVMCYSLVILPFEGYVIMYASDSTSLETPIAGRENYQQLTLPFKKGQHFEFEISNTNLIGNLSYEIKKMSKDRVLVNGIFTYYLIIPEKDGPTTLWEVPITLKKSFWVDGLTLMAQSDDYVALLWNTYIGSSITDNGQGTLSGLGEDSYSRFHVAPDYGKSFNRILLSRRPNIRKVDMGYESGTRGQNIAHGT